MEAMSFAVYFKYVAMVALIGFSLAILSDGCIYSSECEVNQVCCYSDCVYGSSCVGQYCSLILIALAERVVAGGAVSPVQVVSAILLD